MTKRLFAASRLKLSELHNSNLLFERLKLRPSIAAQAALVAKHVKYTRVGKTSCTLNHP